MGDVSAEPSMEDILSSIKRIIAEEGESAAANRVRRPARPAASPAMTAASELGGSDEVLELRDTVPAAPTVAPFEAPAVAAAPAPAVAPVEPILSPKTAEVSRGALDTLSRLVVKADGAPADNTLEALVRELLRPMLREWLDAKLPGIVEAMVSREIARITNQGR